MNKPYKIGFIGLGLIGGSIARAIRQYYPDSEIIAFDKSRETLALATQESVINVACTSIDNNFSNCHYIFLCAPVSYNTAYLKQIKHYVTKDCILTDVGSVKTSIHEEIIALDMEENFIGGHPMAGSEKSGFLNSKSMLIENAYFILTPSSTVSQDKVTAYSTFVESLKALPVILDYKEHDLITGTISHLPHIIASTLVNFVKDTDTKDELMKQLAAGGFKDITRIASSSPVMWQNICASNREPILSLMDQYLAILTKLRGYIDSSNEQALLSFFQQAKDYRDSITLPSVKSPTVYYECFVDLVDETGGIAAVAGLLAQYHISIKNIGIVNNREFEEGVLQLAFPDKQTLTRAKRLLTDNGYMVHER